MILYLDAALMEKMCHPLAVAVFNREDDPIPTFRPHVSELLESALAAPQQSFGGNELYPDIVSKAAILYISLIRNHPFPNGNKRVATASLLVFLHINDHWFRADNEEVAAKAIYVADSVKSGKSFDELKIEIMDWIKNHLTQNNSN